MDYDLCLFPLFNLFIEPLLIESRNSDAAMREWVAITFSLMEKITSTNMERIRHSCVFVFSRSTSNEVWGDCILSRDCFMLCGSNGNETCHS